MYTTTPSGTLQAFPQISHVAPFTKHMWATGARTNSTAFLLAEAALSITVKFPSACSVLLLLQVISPLVLTFIVLVLAAAIALWTSASGGLVIWTMLSSVGLMGATTALLQGGLFGLAGLCPPIYVQVGAAVPHTEHAMLEAWHTMYSMGVGGNLDHVYISMAPMGATSAKLQRLMWACQPSRHRSGTNVQHGGKAASRCTAVQTLPVTFRPPSGKAGC